MSGLDAHVVAHRPHLEIDIHAQVELGRAVALVGPNGAGKSTFVHAVCGLVPLLGGRIAWAGAVWEDPRTRTRTAPQQRSVGTMFQDPSLWPGMSALDNVAYGLCAQRVGRREARKQAMTVLESLDAAQIAPARAETLSGGEAQRVALARALAVAPDVLLLDEPTSSLDAAGRVVTRRVIEKALAAFKGAAVIVTHDPVEAMALADEIVVVEKGRVTQSGTPGDMRARPRSDYVSQLVGVNLLRGRASGDRIELDGGATVVAPAGVSGNVFVAIHPSAVALYRERPQGTPRNVWPLDVAHLDDEGERVRVQLAGSPALIAEVTPTAVSELRLHERGSVWAVVKATQVEIYPR